MGFGDGMGLMWLWWLAGLAFLALLVWGILRAGGATPVGGRDGSPETVLKRRYARGDISREEYERKLTDLRK